MQEKTMEKRVWMENEEVSLLGFGCMRFPLLENGKIDEVEAEKMIDRALKAGVNYIDTAYPYHNGDSEPFVGRVLDRYDRSSYYLATKLPVWKIETKEEAQQVFEEQLKRLNKDYVDFYLLHALNRERFEKVKKLGLLGWLDELKQSGKIRHIGFSFHDEFEVFDEIIHSRKWDFCQLQLNYMDMDIQAGQRGYDLAEEMGVPIVVMEPIKGGMLATLPQEVRKEFDRLRPGSTPASWALRYVGSMDNVKVILSGMSAMDQVENNLETFCGFEALNKEEKEAVNRTAEVLKARVKNGCTGCSYCMPCPAGVNIPQNFKIWNEWAVYDNKERACKQYFTDLAEAERADVCVACGKCEKVCPQKLSIREDLKRVRADMQMLAQSGNQ